MLTVGPSPISRDDPPCWWVEANKVLVASLGRDHAGRWWAHLNLHSRGHVQHIELDHFDTERLERWARANEARLLRECPARVWPAPPDLSPEAFTLTPPEPRRARKPPALF